MTDTPDLSLIVRVLTRRRNTLRWFTVGCLVLFVALLLVAINQEQPSDPVIGVGGAERVPRRVPQRRSLYRRFGESGVAGDRGNPRRAG